MSKYAPTRAELEALPTSYMLTQPTYSQDESVRWYVWGGSVWMLGMNLPEPYPSWRTLKDLKDVVNEGEMLEVHHEHP